MDNQVATPAPATWVGIGVTGYKGSGKDAIGDYLNSTRSYVKRAFAKPLKDACKAIFHFDDDQLYDDVLKEVKDSRWNASPRHVLQVFIRCYSDECFKLTRKKLSQVIGTNLFRDRLGDLVPGVGHGMIWMLSFKIWLDAQLAENPNARIVVTDVRFPNEADFLRSLGFHIVRVKRDGQVAPESHSSETSVDLIVADAMIENTGKQLKDLHQEIEKKIGMNLPD